jgi:hypothetical protein
MALKLGELLVNKKLFTRKQLEEALQAQAVFGGKLGTILIEMGAIGELDLAQVLSNQLGVPFVHPDQLVDIPAAALNALTPELAQKYQVLPLRLEKRILTVVMANPRDLKAIDELGLRTGYVIRPILAPELRLTYALEHYYRIPRKKHGYVPHPAMRKELARLERGGTDAAEPIAAQQPKPSLADMGVDLADMGVDLADMAGEPVRPPLAKPIVVHAGSQLDHERLKVLMKSPGGLPFSLKLAAQKLTEARHHEDIAAALLLYLGTRYTRVALFKVAGGQVIGWSSALNGLPVDAFQNHQFSLDEASALKTVLTSQNCFCGPLGMSRADLELLNLFGEPFPENILILPLIMRGKVVCLIYLGDPMLDQAKALSDLQQITEKALLSFELLIIKSKILRL